jgi:hypothetical protein
VADHDAATPSRIRRRRRDAFVHARITSRATGRITATSIRNALIRREKIFCGVNFFQGWSMHRRLESMPRKTDAHAARTRPIRLQNSVGRDITNADIVTDTACRHCATGTPGHAVATN